MDVSVYSVHTGKVVWLTATAPYMILVRLRNVNQEKNDWISFDDVIKYMNHFSSLGNTIFQRSDASRGTKRFTCPHHA
jgi:hypothetical protein